MKYLFLFVAATFFLACQNQTPKLAAQSQTEIAKTMDTQPFLIHTVFFWNKEGTTEQEAKDFEAGLVKLGTCPQIQKFHWGPPAPTENRDVVDNTYDYAINVFFNSKEDQAEYQEEPIHLAFIEAHKDLWDKVIVYDNLVK